jgi:hypothetical protein
MHSNKINELLKDFVRKLIEKRMIRYLGDSKSYRVLHMVTITTRENIDGYNLEIDNGGDLFTYAIDIESIGRELMLKLTNIFAELRENTQQNLLKSITRELGE